MESSPSAAVAIVVRPPAKNEAAPLAALAEATFCESWQAFNTRGDMDAYCAANFTPARVAADLESPSVRLLVAEAGGELAGYLRWLPGGAAGVFALPAIFPAVPRKQAVIRTAYMSTHKYSQIDYVLGVLDKLAKKYRIRTTVLVEPAPPLDEMDSVSSSSAY